MSDGRDWSPSLSTLLEQVIQREARGEQAVELLAAAGRARDRGVAHLASLIGDAGAHALRQRSLSLARRRYPWLADVVAPDGQPDLPRSLEVLAQRSSAETRAAASALLAIFTDLVVTFLGERITLKLFCEIWPDLIPLLRNTKESP